MRRDLLYAAVLLAAGCSATQPVSPSAAAAGSPSFVGSSGPQDPSGAVGAQGATGPVGAVQSWTSYRNFRFDGTQSDIRSGEMGQVAEIATYIQQNPSIMVGIDGYAETSGMDAFNLSQRRVNTVRDALIQAGVPAERIQAGAFGDQRLKSNGRVEVLVRSGS